MGYHIAKVLVSILLLPLFACQSTNSQKETIIEDAEIDMNDLLPASMWGQESQKSSAPYYYLLGEYLAMRGQIEDSFEFFDAAYNIEPNSFLAQKSLYVEKMQTNDPSLVDKARKMTLLYPKDPMLHVYYGELLARNGEFDKAIAATQQALKEEESHVPAHLQLIGLYKTNQDQPHALATAKNLTLHHPQNPLGWMMLAHLHFSKKNYKDALYALRKAYHLADRPADATFFLVLLLDLNNKQEKANRLLEKFYQNSLSEEEFIARAIGLIKAYESPEKVLERIDQINAKDPAAKTNLQLQKIFILWELGRNDESLAILNQLMDLHSESQQIVYMLGRTHEKVGHESEAINSYLAVEKNSKYFLAARINMLRLLQKSNMAKAVEIFETMIADSSASWEIYTIGAALYAEKKELKKSLEIVRAGYARFPSKVKLLFLRGVYEEKLAYYMDCMATMRQVIEQDPINSAAYNYLGYLFAERGEKLDEAERLILKALSLKPNDGYFVDSLAYVYFQRKDYPKALELFMKAAELCPDEPVILEHLADVLKIQGKLSEALEHLEKATKLEAEDRDSERIMKKYQELKERPTT